MDEEQVAGGALHLFTSGGTVLFVDPATGDLRHGPPKTGLTNVVIGIEELGVRLLLDAPSMDLITAAPGGRVGVQRGAADTADGSVFRRVPAGHGAFGLRSGGLFLSAQPDGSIAFDREHCLAWEMFTVPAEGAAALSLRDLFEQYGTDKARGAYPGVYESLFRRYRRDVGNVLEIGIGTMIVDAHSSMARYAAPGYRPGGSLRAWRDYFEQATICGFDVQPDTQFSDENRIITRICDSRDAGNVQNVMAELARRFDIIIDDGSHYVDDQIATMESLAPHLAADGFYIVEDVVGDNYRRLLEEVKPVWGNVPHFVLGPANNMLVILGRQ